MNSEELELSLRTEFESYLKGFLAEFRQDVSEFQKKFEAEFEKHKAQTDDALRSLTERFEKGVEFDRAFSESVVEHLRLARDEGATITAAAIGEAEKLKEDSAPAPEFDKLRDAINEISSKTTQAEILTALVNNASHFARRGAFFIVKNESFAAWRVFGEEADAEPSMVAATQFSVSADTVLARSVEGLSTVAAPATAQADNGLFLDPLNFGTPDRMYAIPLVARGRGVAVLYADFGRNGVSLNPEALETLVRVAGLTVELMAAGHAAQPAVPAPVHTTAYTEPVQEAPVAEEVNEPAGEYEFETGVADEPASFSEEYSEADTAYEISEPEPEAFQEEAVDTAASYETQEPEAASTEVETAESYEFESTSSAYDEQEFETSESSFETASTAELEYDEPAAVEELSYNETVEEDTPETTLSEAETAEEFQAAEPSFAEEAEAYEPVQETAEPEIEEPVVAPFEPVAAEPLAEVSKAQESRVRYRDRNVDLPIEVPEEERRMHNDARRFARLLVSEIKLYNEQKVAEGRESGDLYDRLREAIDRSREMYDKRVQMPVAEKFDYFHYELVSSLAEGEDVRLGATYPGSKVPA